MLICIGQRACTAEKNLNDLQGTCFLSDRQKTIAQKGIDA